MVVDKASAIAAEVTRENDRIRGLAPRPAAAAIEAPSITPRRLVKGWLKVGRNHAVCSIAGRPERSLEAARSSLGKSSGYRPRSDDARGSVRHRAKFG